MDRKDENRDRKARLRVHLAEMFTQADMYALGQKPQIKGQAPTVLLDELLNYLVSNTYSKLGYIKVRQADPIAEIKAVLSADSLGQIKIAAATTADGNALALAEMRQYLGVAASSSRVLLSDVIDRFAGAPWGWRPEWETVLLIARLFMAGEVKLVMEGNDLDPKTAVEPLTKAVRFKAVSILKRKTSDATVRTSARELHRDMFTTMPPDDEDALVTTFRESLGKLKTELAQAHVKAEQKHYPGATEIAQALAMLERQLAIRDPFEFLDALVKHRKDWLDLGEDTHDVLSFYKTQAPVWARMLETLTSVADNREALAKDPATAAALQALESIGAQKAPYGQVNRIEALVLAVEKANEALAAERREKALRSVDAKLAEALHALDAAHADADLRNRVLKPLQDLKAQLAGLVSVPRILFLQGRGGELLDEAMDKIAHATKPAATAAPATAPLSVSAGGSAHSHGVQAATASTNAATATPVQPSRPIKVIRIADLGAKTYLETEAEVQAFITGLRDELLAAVRAGHKVRVQ